LAYNIKRASGETTGMDANRIDTLLAKMTLSEKLGQMTMSPAGSATTGPVRGEAATESIRAGEVGSLLNIWGREATNRFQKLALEETRLGIPLLFGVDVLHGHKTVFPIPLAEAGLFDPGLWERTAWMAAREAASEGADLTFAPMLDIARDPRWGRVAEGAGEDPLVGARFARAKVRGFQGPDLAAPGALAATAKHFVGGGAALAGREYASVDVSERALHETYLPPFRAAVEAGCAAIMAAFNSLAGVPMTAHVPLLRGYLREKLGFDGVIMSDYAAIEELIDHGVAADRTEAASLALKAGVDLDMVSGVYLAALPEALARGLADMRDIDAAVRRILMLKMELGLFDDPCRRARPVRAAPRAAKKLALEVARRAITLLANDGILPLDETVRRIAVIGPLAEARNEMVGPWTLAGDPRQCSTIVEGLRAALPDREIVYAQGVTINGDDESGIAAARALCAGADAVILCLGEAANMSGEAASRAHPGLPGRQFQLAQAVLASGRPVVALLSSGRPLIVPLLAERANALVATWFLGAGAGQAIGEVLAGRFNPCGRLPITWPRDVGQIPIFFAEKPAARPANPNDPFTSKYIDIPSEPLFPFGHGLSYAKVELANPRLGQAEFRRGEHIQIDVDAENLSDRAADETIFLFSRDRVAAAAPPALELKDWAKVKLAARQKKTVSFTLAAEDLSCLGADLQPVLEPGDFNIFVGLNADRRTMLSARLRCLG
jgi:beta-glucosidase